MEGLLSILGKVGFDWQVALANLVNFLIIFFVLKKFAFKPIGRVIDERNIKINKGLADAEEYAKLLKEAETKYQEALTQAKIESDTIVKQAKKEAGAQKVRMLEQAKVEVDLMIASGKKTLEAEKNKMLVEAKKEMIELVTRSTEKVMAAKIDSQFSDKMIKVLQ